MTFLKMGLSFRARKNTNDDQKNEFAKTKEDAVSNRLPKKKPAAHISIKRIDFCKWELDGYSFLTNKTPMPRNHLYIPPTDLYLQLLFPTVQSCVTTIIFNLWRPRDWPKHREVQRCIAVHFASFRSCTKFSDEEALQNVAFGKTNINREQIRAREHPNRQDQFWHVRFIHAYFVIS